MEKTGQRCYYEVLEVPRNANADDLKISYRRLVLQWHPDKNLDQLEYATEKFKELQHAYTILNDPHERAWYDSHRESILRGDSRNGEVSEEDDPGINLWPFFSSACYEGYEDDERSFYTIYRKVFQQIDAEEAEAFDSNGKEKFETAPLFGDSKSDYEDVNQFYLYWTAFVSRKPFSWCDKYNLNTAQNRQVRRAMEKENKKIVINQKRVYRISETLSRKKKKERQKSIISSNASTKRKRRETKINTRKEKATR